MDALFLGVLIAWLLRYQPALLCQRYILSACALTSAGMLWLLSLSQGVLNWQMSVIGHSIIALFFGAALVLVVRTPALQRVMTAGHVLPMLGRGAYSIYLFHLPVLALVAMVRGHSISTLPIATAVTPLVAAITWRTVERPLIEFGHATLSYGPLPGGPPEQRRGPHEHVTPPTCAETPVRHL